MIFCVFKSKFDSHFSVSQNRYNEIRELCHHNKINIRKQNCKYILKFVKSMFGIMRVELADILCVGTINNSYSLYDQQLGENSLSKNTKIHVFNDMRFLMPK